MTSSNSPGPLAAPPAVIKRVAFLGTPVEAATVLQALIDADVEVAHVVTQPDRRRGRGSALMPSPVKVAAGEAGLEVSHEPSDLAGLDVDLAVVVAFGQLISRSLLEQLPMVNLHFSLLPRWRGAAPVERAILAGDAETGVAVMKLEEGLDTGPVYASATTPIDGEDTAGELRHRLTLLGIDLLLELLIGGFGSPVAQKGVPVYASKITRDETRLDPRQAAIDLHRRIRVGRAWTTFRSKRLVIEQAVLPAQQQWSGPTPAAGTVLAEGGAVSVVGGDGRRLELQQVKPEGKRSMPAIDWANGVQPRSGEQIV